MSTLPILLVDLAPALLLHLLEAVLFSRPLRMRARKSKITDFNIGVLVNENIAWFEISVHDIEGVKEVEATEQIVHYRHDVLFRHFRREIPAQHLLQVAR